MSGRTSRRGKRVFGASVWAALACLALAACGSPFNTGPVGDAGAHDATRDGPDGGLADAPAQDVAEDAPPAKSCGTGFQCVPGIPVGWTGPVELYLGTTTPPACDPAFAATPVYSGNDLLSAPGLGCSCSCGPPGAVVCAAPSVTVYSDATCSTVPCHSFSPAVGKCGTTDFSSGCSGGPTFVHLDLPAGKVIAGSCTPTMTVPSRTPPSWGGAGQACEPAAKPTRMSCGVLELCAPASASPYLAGACVKKSGDVECPAFGYTKKHVLYGSFDDTRACSPCTCGSVSGSCAPTLHMYLSSDTSCSGIATDVTETPCSTMVAADQRDIKLTMSAIGGSCASSGGMPTGSATATDPTTFCCVP